MEVAEALGALQLAPGATWDEVRAHYRRLLRAHHPDLTSAPGAADRTARLTTAYAVLREATGGGRRPLPAPRSAPAPPAARRAAPAEPKRRAAAEHAGGAGTAGAVVGRRSPEEVFGRLRAAAPAVGSLSGVDPETLSLQILVEAPGAPPAQLLAEVYRREGDTAIMFTLESLTAAPGPPIEAIVKRLLAAL